MKFGVLIVSLLASFLVKADYDVRMPSDLARPRWSGAKVGEWTMDYKSACAQAAAEGKGVLVLTTGSWWCPHCEAFEEKVLLANAWRWNEYVKENGFYLVMLDFPYRGHVKDAEISKSRYPEFGDGWGFKCWLYDDDYLEENGLTKEDGLNAIMEMYRLQKSLALPEASQVTIKTWDGKEDFTYGKVGYPTLIVYLPDGKEAGRFSPGSTNRDPDDAYNYVVEKIDAIMAEALDKDCGLCSEPEEWGLSGEKAQTYRGWLKNSDSSTVGTVEVKTGRKNRKSDIKISAKVCIGGKTTTLNGTGHDCCIDKVVLSGRNGAQFELLLSENGMSGEYVNGNEKLVLTGARDVFVARDAVAKARAKLVEGGTWTLAMSVENPTDDYARGYGAFSVKVQKNGKTTLTGTLPDGTSVSVRSAAIVGDSDVYCVPISIDAYRGKKGGVGFNLWFKNGWLFNVNGLRKWESVGTRTFAVPWRPIYSAIKGAGEIKRDMELVFLELPEMIGGKPVVSDPDLDTVTAKQSIWKGTGASKFSATFAKASGLLNGSLKFWVTNGKRDTAKTCRLFGVAVDGTAYCSVQLGKDGNLPLKVTSCNACED